MTQRLVVGKPARPRVKRPLGIIEMPFLPQCQAGLLVDIIDFASQRDQRRDEDIDATGIRHQLSDEHLGVRAIL